MLHVQGTKLNFVLATLSLRALSEIHSQLRSRDFTVGTALWEAGDYADHVVFPVSGTISIRVPTREGNEIVVGTIGPEGAVGFPDELGGRSATRADVEVPGRFMVISAPAFFAATLRNEEISRLAAACKRWMALQSQQIAACNAVHSADARLCRWLLRASDTLALELVPATQEMIGDALGIRRTTATLIAQKLQMQGIISYSRGRIAIRDRDRLQAEACDCNLALGQADWPSELLRMGDASVSA